MDLVSAALQDVETAVARCKPKDKKRLTEIAGHVASHLVLLKLHSISEQIVRKLSAFLRESLRVLYEHISLPALRLASAIFQAVYYERLLPTIGNLQREQQEFWEMVLHALLAGVLDYLDAHDTKEAKDAIGEALYPSLCEVCLSLTAPKTSVDLRCTAYSILSDSAAAHPPNQLRLRDKHILGGESLGSCIWRTKEYLPLEGLLNLFARALPSTHNSTSGRSKRTAYIHSVFTACSPPDSIVTAKEIAELLENVPTSNWEETALRIVDLLAEGNIAYPQPFHVTEVRACGNAYPSDRLYADNKAFLANVLLSDDQYESLEIAYSTIERIEISHMDIANLSVVLSTNASPRLGKENIGAGCDSDAELKYDVLFVLQVKQRSRLMAALESRGLTHLVSEKTKDAVIQKLSLAAQPAMLDFDAAGRPVAELSQEERIENVSQFYRTEDPSDDIVSADVDSALDDATAILPTRCLPSDGHVTNQGGTSETKLPAVSASSELRDTSRQGSITGTTQKSLTSAAGAGPLSRTGSHLVRAAAFGLSDEELSDISDYDSPLPRSTALRRSSTATSLVRGRISFQPIATKSTGTSSSATRVARGGLGKVVLDSDDEPPSAALVSSASRRPTKKAALIREPTIDDSQLGPGPALTAVPAPASSPPLANLPVLAAPAAATPSPAPGDETLVSSNAPEKVLRFSDIPAPDFNAPLSSPAVVPKSALKSALVKPTTMSVRQQMLALDARSATGTVPSVSISAVPLKNTKVPVTSFKDILSDLAPPWSSPTPAAKRSVKAALRKKDKVHATVNETVKPAVPKRKLVDQDDVEELVPSVGEDVRATKRLRTSTVPEATTAPEGPEDDNPRTVVIDERSESQVLRPRRTAAARATKKYHAKKGRESQPVESPPLALEARPVPVDYDALPSPPRASTVPVQLSSPTPKGQRDAKPNPKSKPKPKPKVGQADITKAAAKGVKELPPERDGIKQEAIVVAPARKTRASARSAGLKEKSALTKDHAAVQHLADVLPTAVVSKPHAEQQQRDVPTQGEGASEVEVIDVEDVPAHVDELMDPVHHSEIDNVALPAPDENTTLTAKPEVGDPSTAGCRLAAQDEASMVSRVTKPSAAKKSTTTPWDAIAHSTPSVRTGADIEDDRLATHGGLPTAAVDSGRLEIDGAGSIVSELPGAQKVVASPSVITIGLEPRPLSRMATQAPVAEQSEGVASRMPHIFARKTGSLFDNNENASIAKVTSKPLPVQVKRGVETIDLTCETPPRPSQSPAIPMPDHKGPSAKLSPTNTSAAMQGNETRRKILTQDTEQRDILAYLVNIRRDEGQRDDRNSRGVLCQADKETDRRKVPPLKVPKELSRKTDVVQESVAGASKSRSDQPTQRIIEVLGRFNDVITHNIMHGFEGVRRHARLGRSQLLRDAVADLQIMQADSVAQFNNLVDLEAEYATVGRRLIHQSEDWIKTNRELSQRLAEAVEQHDKMMLSKKMPATLIASPL
ncbi:hypothetical protein OH77DRAFT_1513260 [Trametes cingulata]|nr:hypothetical protein OH77DRAFT_1513260 [Trametes cingulata]